MTGPTFGAARPQYRRAGNGRPYIKTPEGKEMTYSRVTTFIDCLEDKRNLEAWDRRMVLIGAMSGSAADRTLLAKSVKTAVATEDRNTLNELADNAKTLARSSAKAEEGTANHSLTELIDTGRMLPEGLDGETLADLDAYETATAGGTVLDIECGVVHHGLKTAGTFDRRRQILPGHGWPEWLEGRVVVDDLKTGRVDFGLAKMAMQLALYANSDRYDITTGVSQPLDVDRTVGLITHLPVGQARCDIYALDLTFGWASVQLAHSVREFRRVAKKTDAFAHLVKSFDLATGQVAA